MIAVCADPEDSSDPESAAGGGFSPGPSIHSPTRNSPDDEDIPVFEAQEAPDHIGGGASPWDVHPADGSDDDHDNSGPDYDSDSRCHAMDSHLAKLDSLTARGCADKFFEVHTKRWAPSFPRPGDDLHSARAGGVDVRETRKRKAAHLKRSVSESHSFCTSSNLSQERSNMFMEGFTNVRCQKF